MSKKSYEIAFRLGAKMDSSLRTAFANANKSMGQLNKNSHSLSRSTGTLTKSFGSFGGTITSIPSKVGSMVKSVSGGITRGLIAPFKGAIGMVKQYSGALGLLSGGALATSGMQRLSAIENARTSLTVMMGDAERAGKFMDDVLAFARTTPFAFPDLAETSRNLIAFGMDEAKVVPTLKAIGDAAAATGKGSEGLNQVASAFGDMQIAGKLGLDQINRLQAAGVPALKILANTFGVSTDTMKKNISKGSVDSVKAIDQLVEGMQKGTKGIAGNTAAMAGIMEETKKNWTGSVDSLKSSISSTMATLIEPAKPHIQNAMAWFGSTFSKLPTVAFAVADKAKPAISTIANVFKSISSVVKSVSSYLSGASGIDVFYRLGLSDDAAKTIYSIVNAIKKNITSLFNSINSVASGAGKGISSVFGNIGPALLGAGQLYLKFNDVVVGTVKKIAPYVKQGLGAVVSVVKNVVTTIAVFWSENGAQIIQALKNVAKIIGVVIRALAPVVLFAIKVIWQNIKGVIDGGLNAILGLIKIFSSIFTGDWSGLWQGIKQTLVGALKFAWNLWNLMMMGRLVKGAINVVQLIVGFFKGLGPRLSTNIQYIYHLFMDRFYAISIGIVKSIGSAISRMIGLVRGGVSNFVTVFQTARTFGVNVFTAIVSAVRNLFSNIFGFISSIVTNVIGAITTRISGFVTSTHGFLMNLWTNITTIFAQIQLAMTTPFTALGTIVQSAVSSASSLVRGLFDGVLASGRGAINSLVVAANAMIGGINRLSFTVPDWVPKLGGSTIGFNLPSIPMLAKGGITTGPTLAMIGEGAEQEAILPLSKLQSLLGAPGGTSTYYGDEQDVQIIYNPQIIIQGNADKDTVQKALDVGYNNFKRWMDKYKKDKDRKGF